MKTQISLMIEVDLLVQIEHYSKKVNLSRSVFITNSVEKTIKNLAKRQGSKKQTKG